MQIEIPARFAGPPAMGHGGYVAGILAEAVLGAAEGAIGGAAIGGAVQITLRRPTPLDVALELASASPDSGRAASPGRGGGDVSPTAAGDTSVVVELRRGEDVIADAQFTTLDIDVPAAPSLEVARAAEDGSPSHYDGRGVHPTCFGCGRVREPGDALRIFAAPVESNGEAMVAAGWSPHANFVGAGGLVDTRWVLAALDCPGAFAFIATGGRAGLLGRIVFEQYTPVAAADPLVVTGWQIGQDGRKLFAGTALHDAAGNVLAAAKATWFQMTGPPRV